jgi:hypothetical protein
MQAEIDRAAFGNPNARHILVSGAKGCDNIANILKELSLKGIPCAKSGSVIALWQDAIGHLCICFLYLPADEDRWYSVCRVVTLGLYFILIESTGHYAPYASC